MTKIEYNKCLNLLREAAYTIDMAEAEQKEFTKTNDNTYLLKFYEHMKYANNIITTLITAGFIHHDLTLIQNRLNY